MDWVMGYSVNSLWAHEFVRLYVEPLIRPILDDLLNPLLSSAGFMDRELDMRDFGTRLHLLKYHWYTSYLAPFVHLSAAPPILDHLDCMVVGPTLPEGV